MCVCVCVFVCVCVCVRARACVIHSSQRAELASTGSAHALTRANQTLRACECAVNV